ncbi:hypothetical protein OUZ56_027659 [Daphnia magna]|uniref:Uncharacterized protein n=1 Tax=Daphnia magna TaxID=35525 RepID=A0ABR0B1J4_9CRUS|nr:hypothetical protein OUZ56_027659 [Daphnia magna]
MAGNKKWRFKQAICEWVAYMISPSRFGYLPTFTGSVSESTLLGYFLEDNPLATSVTLFQHLAFFRESSAMS